MVVTVEMLQFPTPLAKTDNREQEQLDGTPEESLPDDAEDLMRTHDEDTPVTEDCSLSLCNRRGTLTTARASGTLELSCAKPLSSKHSLL